ncbi:hypothetical protein AKJ41_05315 [candidate division MSBL1 archaeon SCGC-AAA259O05]|uniref:Uncharacterized protein n=1 Tax=candidate division MSBL1 archaeon SCGC-AAA259O05 TaxID=1698271 RepID=A0A133UZ90_9EURY|nr:hypothetical protein AKJ41_05315 [candidate division MSBL1 archaeon SCGC-AAA259O05]
MAPVKPDEFSSRIIDLCTQFNIVKDYSLEFHENVVLKSRIYLDKGFVQIYRNFETGKIAFAWLVDGERLYGADNTGEWHIHPYEDPSKHVKSSPLGLEEFLENVKSMISRMKEDKS